MSKWTQEQRKTAAKDIILRRWGQPYADTYWGQKEIELLMENEVLIEIACQRTALLESLKEVVSICDRNTDAFTRARSAIAKAEEA